MQWPIYIFVCEILHKVTLCSAQLVQIFSSNLRRIHSGQKDREKEEYGLLCVAISYEQPSTPTLHTVSPACGYVYQD